MLFHEFYSVEHLSFKAMLSPGFSGSMCGQHIYLVRVALTVIDFSFPVWYSAHRSLGASVMKRRPTVADFMSSTLIWPVEGRYSWKRVILGPQLPLQDSVKPERL